MKLKCKPLTQQKLNNNFYKNFFFSNVRKDYILKEIRDHKICLQIVLAEVINTFFVYFVIKNTSAENASKELCNDHTP